MTFYKNREANLKHLTTICPEQFSTPSPLGFAWPDGWHHLVAGVCINISEVAPAIRWIQIKEKFGGLRMYYADGPLIADNVATKTTIVRLDGAHPDYAVAQPIIDIAQTESLKTCMVCGGHGSRKVKDGYVLTACDACFARYDQ